MTDKKTSRVYASEQLNGEGSDVILASIHVAVDRLGQQATFEKRDILWDTFEISIERNVIEDRSLMDIVPQHREGLTTVNVSALGVKHE